MTDASYWIQAVLWVVLFGGPAWAVGAILKTPRAAASSVTRVVNRRPRQQDEEDSQ